MAHYRIVPLYGQSLAIGARGQPLINTSQPYDSLTFNDGPRTPPVSQSALADLFEAVDVGNDLGETMCSSMCNSANEFLVGSGRAAIPFFSFAPGEGDQEIAALLKGGAYYTRLMDGLENAVSLLGASAHTVSCPAIAYYQGEADSTGSITRADYRDALLSLRADFEADAKLITGQSSPVYMIVGQTNRPRGTNGMPVCLGQIDAAQQDAFTIFAGSMSQFGGASNDEDGTHKTGLGYARMGTVFGTELFRLLCGKRSVPFLPSSARLVGQSVFVGFSGPHKPTIDLTNLADGLIMTNYGLRVLDATGTNAISNIRIERGQLAMDLARPLDGAATVRFCQDYTLSEYGISSGAMTNVISGLPRNPTVSGSAELIAEVAPAYDIAISA